MHVELASRINREIDDRALIVLGKLEQDLVFGDATSKEVIQFLQDYQHIPATDKVLLTYPNISSVTLALIACAGQHSAVNWHFSTWQS